MVTESKLKGYTKIVSYAVGYDITDPDANEYIEALVKAGLTDLRKSGVKQETLESSALIIPALTIFVNDNLQMSAGEYKTSPMYLANVDKLREGYEEHES